MQFAHSRGGLVHTNVHRWGDGDKGLHVAQADLKRFRVAAYPFQGLKCSALRSFKRTWWQESKMRHQMWQIGQPLPPEIFYELAHRTRDVGYQRVTRVLHIRIKIITRFRLSYSSESFKSRGAQPASALFRRGHLGRKCESARFPPTLRGSRQANHLHRKDF